MLGGGGGMGFGCEGLVDNVDGRVEVEELWGQG